LAILKYIISFLLIFSLGTSFSQYTNQYNQLLKELSAARKVNDLEKLAEIYYQLARYEDEKNGNPEKSFDYFSRALEYYKVNEDSTGIYNTRFQIANHLLKNKMFSDATKEFLELRTYFNAKQNADLSAMIELRLFELYLENLEINDAKTTLANAKSYINQVDDSNIEVEYRISQVKYYESVNELDTALYLANQCYLQSERDSIEMNMAKCLVKRGDINMSLGNYQQAIFDYNVSIPILRKVPFNVVLLGVYRNMTECLEQVKKYREANFFLKEYTLLQDSILNENRIIAVNNITYKHKSEENSTKIKLYEIDKAYSEEKSQQQKRALSVLGIGMGILLLSIYYIIRFYREKINTAKIIELQNDKINQQKIQELQDKIQINSMQSMLTGQEQERERIAKDLHDSLGGLLSTIKLQVDNISTKDSNVSLIPEYKKANDLIDTAVSEVRSISQNLQPGALSSLGMIPAINDLINRYDSEAGPEIIFQHYEIPFKINQTVAVGIYRIVQEILNNAIKHSGAKEIFVQLTREQDDIVIHIEDDGKGFDTSKKYKSMGLENIRSRVNYLRGTIEIDSRPNEGTSFLIHVKCKLD